MTSRTWADGDLGKTLSAARMNGIETDIQAALDAAAAANTVATNLSVVIPKIIAATTYTLLLTDQNLGLTFTNAAGCTVTVPPASAVAFPLGWPTEIRQAGGPVTVVQGAGVTITKLGTLITGGVGATLGLANTGTNTWWLSGDTTG